MTPCTTHPNPDIWYSQIATAKALCRRCPLNMQLACLREADRLETGPKHVYGVWGGLSPIERLRRRAA